MNYSNNISMALQFITNKRVFWYDKVGTMYIVHHDKKKYLSDTSIVHQSFLDCYDIEFPKVGTHYFLFKVTKMYKTDKKYLWWFLERTVE